MEKKSNTHLLPAFVPLRLAFRVPSRARSCSVVPNRVQSCQIKAFPGSGQILPEFASGLPSACDGENSSKNLLLCGVWLLYFTPARKIGAGS